MTDPLAVDRIDALSYGQRVVSQSAGGYALERQGSQFFVVRESDRNEVEVARNHVELVCASLAYGGDLGDLLRRMWSDAVLCSTRHRPDQTRAELDGGAP